MGYTPLVSVIIPCYNGKEHIRKCIHSVIQQEYSNKEIIIIDGASTDGSVELIADLASRFSFIKWISEKDQGVYEAMNKGITISSGEWIYFLGLDDHFDSPFVLDEVFSIKKLLKKDFLYGNVRFLYSRQIYNGSFDLHRIIFGGNICHQAIFYKRRVFNIIGNYDTECRIYADHDLNIRCFMNKKIKRAFLDKVISVYNESDGLSAYNKQDEVFRKKQNQYIKQYYSRPLPFLKQIYILVKNRIKILFNI